MRRTQPFFQIAVRILLLGGLILALITVFSAINPSQRQGSQPANQTASSAYPPPPKQNPGTPYPPPIGKSPTPLQVISNTPTIPIPHLTITPLFTPVPTLTLKPGPSPTLIPTIEPAKDASGRIYFVAKAGKDVKPTINFLSTDATGKTISQPAKLSEDEVQSDGFIFPSPDGNHLAITGSWGAFSLYDLNKGRIEPISATHGPVGEFLNWYLDNRQILYRDGMGPLVLSDPISGDHTVLAVPGYEQVTGAAASPDGQYVVYASYRGDNSYSPGGLWIVNANGQNAHVFSKEPATFVANITWSPDGKRIAFWGDGWEVIDADGSNLRQLTNASMIPRIFLPHCYFLPPLWSPDSHIIAIVTSESADSFCHGWADDIFKGTNILLIDIDSGKIQPLLPDGSTGNIDPTWSPDGSQMAFVSNRSGTPEIWAVNMDGSNLRQLTKNDALVRFPVWRRSIP